MSKNTISVYTDGACSGNPGRGGYGVVMILDKTNYKKEFCQGFKKTTNNRMELLAVIVALENLKQPEQEITIYTDSKYVHDTIEKKWYVKWQKTNFKGKKNADLWKRFIPLYRKHIVKTVWVKGHAGNFGNELADRLAVKGSNSDKLLVDEGYEG